MKIIILTLLLAIFINAEVLPFNKTTVQLVFENKTDALILFTNDNAKSSDAKVTFKQFAKSNPEGYLLANSDFRDGSGYFDRLAEHLGVNKRKIPTILFVKEGQAKYVFDGSAITVDEIKGFVERVQAGQVPRYLKSAEPPKNNNKPVKVIVGKQFKELVLDSEKEVLIKFYAPWCGHCKTLAPLYDKAAEKLAGNSNILLAKVDSTLNEIEGVDIKGFPTLKFWGKDKTQPPIDYTGERTTEGILKWLKEHTSYEWTLEETEL